MRKIILLLLTLMLCCVSKISSQVTVGSQIEPERGALLEIKNKKAENPASVTDVTNVTVDASGGGIRLPRVVLVDKQTMEPFIENNSEWTLNTGKIKERHAGLMVYNIKVSSSSETNPDKIFRQGIYIWNGKKWKEAEFGKESFFNLPAFTLPLTLGANTSFDLYEEVYKKQYLTVSGHLYAREELDFVVTYYDTAILKIDDMKDGGVPGKMAYTVLEMPYDTPVPEVLINVVLVVK